MSTIRTASMRGFGGSTGLAGFDAAPEFPLGGNNEVLVKRIGMGLDFNPLAASGDDRKHCHPCSDDEHVVLQLRCILLGCRLLRERPRQHKFTFEDRTAGFDAAIQCGPHPMNAWMPHVLLDVYDLLTGRGLKPFSVQLFSRFPKLHNQIAR
jgi:hypothetical protein